MTMSEPIVCSLEPGELRVRRDALLPGIAGQAEHIEPIDGGIRLRFANAALLTTAAAAIDAERKCCRFLAFVLTVAPADGPMSLEITGPAGTQEFVSDLLRKG
jgi:hypothetical protein